MTRAKDELNILYVKERFGKKVKPSRFINEIVGDENETKAE